MDVVHHDPDCCRMCLNHAQTSLEQMLQELDHQFRRWFAHPGNPALPIHISILLNDLRWQLSKHFDYVTQDHWESALARHPSWLSRLEAIPQLQRDVLQRVERLKSEIPMRYCTAHGIAKLLSRFEELHADMLREEAEERWLVEMLLA